LIRGLDGGTYKPHSPAVVEKVQTALKEKGLYQGEVIGELDEATMKAVGEFQKANNLTVSGVPSPSMRKLLFER
jgi:peptidoglycan hydrolase-like protein with peptidoglycan-binding domain